MQHNKLLNSPPPQLHSRSVQTPVLIRRSPSRSRRPAPLHRPSARAPRRSQAPASPPPFTPATPHPAMYSPSKESPPLTQQEGRAEGTFKRLVRSLSRSRSSRSPAPAAAGGGGALSPSPNREYPTRTTSRSPGAALSTSPPPGESLKQESRLQHVARGAPTRGQVGGIAESPGKDGRVAGADVTGCRAVQSCWHVLERVGRSASRCERGL